MNKIFWFTVLTFFSMTHGTTRAQSVNRKDMDPGNKKQPSFHQMHTAVDNKFYSLAADLSALGDDAGVLFFNDKCIVIGKQGVPYILNASTEFDPSNLPVSFQNTIYLVESVILSSEMSDYKKNEEDYLIPKWLRGFKSMKYLTVEHIRFTPNFFWDCDQLKHLIVVGGLKQDAMMLTEHILELKSLEYLVHSGFLTEQEISQMKAKAPHLTVLSETEYDRKLDNGEIKLPE